MAKNMKRMSQAFAEKLKGLPLVEARRDFSGIDYPLKIANKWFAEIKPSQAALLEELLKHLQTENSG